MAREVINLGTRPNSRDGDTYRAAMGKVNRMTEELYAAVDGIDVPDDVLSEADLVTDANTNDATKPVAASVTYDLQAQINSIADVGAPVIVDALNSTNAEAGLSANQGRVLALRTQGKTIPFDTRSLAVGADIGDAERVVIFQQVSGGPQVMCVYDVQSGTTGNADDAADLLAGEIQFANSKYGALVSLDGRWFPEAFGAPRNGTDDDAAAINACRSYAITNGGGIVWLAPYSYVIGSTITLDNSAWFYGVQIQGCGPEETILLAKPGAISTPILHMRGGSGNTTNKAIRGLTIKPFDSGYNNLGIGIQVENQCFAVVEDVKLETLAVGVELANTTASGSFTEHNQFNRVRTLNCTRGIQFHRRGGDNSFHGNDFHGCQIDVPSAGTGLYLNGASIGGTANSGSARIYNCLFDIKIFGGSGTRTAIYHDNIATDANISSMRLEAALQLDAAPTSGPLNLTGPFFTIENSITMTANGRGRFNFDLAFSTQQGAIPIQSVNSTNPTQLANAYRMGLAHLGKIAGANSIPAMEAIKGDGTSANMTGAVHVITGPASRDGLLISNRSNGSYTNTAGLLIRGTGGVIETYAGKLDIRETGISDQLVIDDGRFGGKLGRLPPVTSISASGSAQNITLWQNDAIARSSSFYLRITGTGYDRFIRGEFVSGNGAAGDVIITREYSFTDTTSGAVSATPTLSVDTAARLILTITTDRTLTLSGWEVSGGTVLTA